MKAEKPDFVIIGLQPWYISIGSNCKNIALTLSRDYRVLYINSPLDRRTLLRKNQDENIARHAEVVAGQRPALEQVNENLWVYHPRRVLESLNWIPSTPLFAMLNGINSARFARDIREATGRLDMKRFILFNDNEMFRSMHLKRLLRPELYIYYCRDYLRAVPYWKRHGQVMEPRNIRQADIAMANSAYLREYLSKYNPVAVNIGQGCDTTLFDGKKDYSLPEDVASIRGPRVGYIGALTSLRLDIAIIELIARQMPDWQVVLVGPEDDSFRRSRLHQLDNVHFPGRKPLQDLPRYIRSFDVCINPQVVNAMTVGNYPLKIDEYLNMGKPVVATRTPTMEEFSEHVALADRPEDYPRLIREAHLQNGPARAQARMEFASAHTWPAVIERMMASIRKSF